MEVRWTTPAAQDFAAAGAWLAARDPAAAERVPGLVVERTEALAEFPQLGRPGRVPGTRELAIAGTPYIVAYQLRPDCVAIVAFLHAKRR